MVSRTQANRDPMPYRFDERQVAQAAQYTHTTIDDVAHVADSYRQLKQREMHDSMPHANRDPTTDPSDYTRENGARDELKATIARAVAEAHALRSTAAELYLDAEAEHDPIGSAVHRLTQIRAEEDLDADADGVDVAPRRGFLDTVASATTGVCGDLVDWTSLPCEPTFGARAAYVFREETRFPVVLAYALLLVLLVTVIRYLAA